jgi:BirA family biotin operon repressor/biotin-[acetyl-CoA-carboxylase] ligase
MDIMNISEDKIKQQLSPALRDQFQFQIYQTIDSTNTRMKELAVKGAPAWTVLLAEEQTNGRGRMNRNFYSPYGTGIYMSILLRPDFLAEASGMLTVMAAVAVTDAILQVYGIETEIKWVNDVYFQQKKVCGILAEAAMKPDYKMLDYVVLGIGINVETPRTGFPEELLKIATSLDTNLATNVTTDFYKDEIDKRSMLITSVLQNISKYYELAINGEMAKILECYRKRSFLIGRQVVVVGNETELLRVIGIGDKGELIVQDSDGNRRFLSSGEVSVKEWNEYES